MTDWNACKNKIINAALDQPLLTSLFVADFAVLVFHRPPFIFSILMMGGLVGMCMYFGQKLALFKIAAASASPKAAAAVVAKPAAPSETKAAVAAEAKVTESKSAKPAAKARAKAKS